jgi:hypothetical protein
MDRGGEGKPITTRGRVEWKKKKLDRGLCGWREYNPRFIQIGMGELMYKTGLVFLATLLVAGVVVGEDFWVKKDYTQWTDEEVKKIMTNSPWAKDVLVSAPAGVVGGGRRSSSANGIDVENTGGARGGRGARTGGQAEAQETGPADVQLSLNVSWRSALPLRKAVVKSRADASSDVKAEMQQSLEKEQEDYVVVVSGIPARMNRLVQDPARLKQSSLRIGKRAAVAPKSVDLETHTQTLDLFFVFPKGEPITLEDKEVELDLKLGAAEAKRKFSLKDMVYNGKLEL